jgi:CopG family transcriptional regulator, nickel-responsive regulator
MAKIISISLDEETLKELEDIQSKIGFSGRSETIRAGLSLLSSENKDSQSLKGKIGASLIVVHKEHSSREISAISHKHQKLIQTHIHNHLDNHKCLEIFVLNGDGKEIKSLYDNFQKSKKTDFVKLIVY